jgi:hypothetical protein
MGEREGEVGGEGRGRERGEVEGEGRKTYVRVSEHICADIKWKGKRSAHSGYGIQVVLWWRAYDMDSYRFPFPFSLLSLLLSLPFLIFK